MIAAVDRISRVATELNGLGQSASLGVSPAASGTTGKAARQRISNGVESRVYGSRYVSLSCPQVRDTIGVASPQPSSRAPMSWPHGLRAGRHGDEAASV